MRNIYPLNSRFALPFLFVLVISLLFMLPGGILQAQTSDDNFEYAENGTSPVATFTAMDPEQTAIASWSLAGTDAGAFNIAGGVLTFKESPNFEMPGDIVGEGDPTAAANDNMYELTVQATDETNKIGSKPITVTVINVDEPGTVMLSALRPQSAADFTATLTDPDTTDPTNITGLTWQWAKASSRNGTYSDIDGAMLVTYQPQDADVNSYLRATVSYTDGQGSDKSAMSRSEYAVQAVRGNNEPPVFAADQDPVMDGDQANATRMVPENTAAGMAIGNPVVATDDNGDVLTYTISEGADSFDINRATGQLMTKAALDFEGTPSHMVTVRATDPSGDPLEETLQTANADEVEVVITVTNVDEPPAVEGDAAAPFQEEAGDIVQALDDYEADDPETTGDNNDSVVTWSLTGADAGKFDISDTGALTFKAKPDFEAQGDANGDNVYEVTVTATDDTGNRGTLAVKVTVANEDEDGDVKLSRTQPRVGVPVRATLTDADSSISGVSWQWYRGQNIDNNVPTTECADENANNCLIADATSDAYVPTAGDVGEYLTAAASYTDGESSEDSDPKFAAGEAANGTALDTRNRAPVFIDQDMDTDGIQNDSATRKVDENADAMTMVGSVVQANDPDPNSDPLIYTLSGADASLFTVDPDDPRTNNVDEGGQIKVGANTKLDYETRNSYMVTLTAEDSFGATASISVTIRVNDLDEVPDVAGDDAVEYPENGTGTVTTFTAMDQDGTGIASWSLAGTDAGAFNVAGGVLTFKESPNHEDPADVVGQNQNGATAAANDNIYELTVQAIDGTNKMGSKAITVTVMNVDEPGTVMLSALRPQSATMFNATLTDPDSVTATNTTDEITTATWQWAKASSRNGTYNDIDRATGTTYEPKDEDVNSYLRATASYADGQGSDKSAMSRSVYAVQAVRGNNEAPEFTDQDPVMDGVQNTTATRMVPENTPAGMAIGNPLVATDENGDVLTYTLVDGNNADSFDINQATGQLLTKAALDEETGPTYTVTVKVTDPTGVPDTDTNNSDTIIVTITVTDVDEPPAVMGDAAVTFQENTTTTQSPTTYTADDPETADAPTWSLTGADAGKFNNLDINGTLTFKAAPDFEAQGDANGDNIYEVTVTATDGTGNRGTLAVKVTVANVNEDGDVKLSRTQPRVGVPVRATLTDPDGSISSVTWTWYRADNIAAVPVQSALTTTACADETSNNCVIEGATSDTYVPTAGDVGETLTAVASYTDGESSEDSDPKLAAGVAANGTALDTRNRAPEFVDQDMDTDGIQNDSAARKVDENAAAMTMVGSVVQANDPDPNTDPLIYTLSGADASLFTVDPDDPRTNNVDEGGQIKVGANTKLDYETRNSYMVTLTAEDSFGATASIPVTIRVNDVDEVPLITGSLPEALGISGRNSVGYPENGTASVETYTATGLNAASARWSLDGDDADDFRVSGGGVLAFRSSPDYEMPADTNTDNVYMVTVKATSGSEMATRDVTITVTDVILSISGRNDIEYAENLTASVETYTTTGPAIRWSLEGTDADDFTIEANDGRLWFANAPDFEMPADDDTDNVYMITVRATSGTETDTHDVSITVTDEALMISGRADIDYEENGTASVETFVAEGPNAASAMWSLEGVDADDFAISSAGELTFMSPPDYEMSADANIDNVYMVTVKATSGSETATHVVTVTVTNEDEQEGVLGDANGDGRIDRLEMVTAIGAFVDGDLTRVQMVDIIRLYLRFS